MSLEQHLKENTEAIKQLIAVIQAAGITTVAGNTPEPGANEPSQPIVPPAGSAPEASAEQLEYSDIQKPFLRLVNKNKDAALALLKELGVNTLRDIQGKPELFASVKEKIEKASA